MGVGWNRGVDANTAKHQYINANTSVPSHPHLKVLKMALMLRLRCFEVARALAASLSIFYKLVAGGGGWRRLTPAAGARVVRR